MSLVPTTQFESSGGDVGAIIDGYDREQALRSEGAWPQALLRMVCSGSAGAVVLVTGYWPYFPRVGTSPSVVDSRSAPPAALVSANQPRTATTPPPLRAVLAMSIAEQAQEALAALSLNKTQLAEILGVSRPTLYDWLDGKDPNAANAKRLTMILELLRGAAITSANPLSGRLVRQVMSETGVPLLDALRAETLDERLVSSLLREAKALGDQAASRRLGREERLRALGFEEPTDEQRREQLARSMAMKDWPKP